MKVVAAVNGLITAEVAAQYALRYAALHGFSLTLLYVRNPLDRLDDVERSMAVVEEAAAIVNVATERVMLDGEPAAAIRDYVADNRVDTLFCSTSRRRHLFDHSLRRQLVRQPLAADLAVVLAVRLDAAYGVRNIILPIREDRLSVKKFALFAAFAKSYNAAAEIYSISRIDTKKLAEQDIPLTRSMLRKINDRLSHYGKLSRFIGIPLRVKHAATANELNQLLHHLSHRDFQLMIIGGQRPSLWRRLLREDFIERLFRETPINIVAFYGRDHG